MAIDQGMSIGEVKALAEQLKTAAGKFDGIMQLLSSRVDSTSWVGPDAARFKNDWWPAHRSRLQQLRTDLEGFGQSAANNATEQEGASNADNGGAVLSPSPAPITAVGQVSASSGQSASQITPTNRDIADVQNRYDQWAASRPGGETRFGSGGESQYQCTGWANFRWHELGYDGPPIHGNGGAMAANAPGDVSVQPSLHAMASYGSGVGTDYGHVMIVEEVSADGSRIRVSEMNVGDKNYEVGLPSEYRDSRWISRQPNGTFAAGSRTISFAPLPGN